MRDIEFRAWDRINKKWIGKSHLEYLCVGNDVVVLVTYKPINGHYEPESMKQLTNATVDNLDIVQSIGRFDKNNKKIFENDYILCTRYPENPQKYLVLIKDIRSLPRELFGSELIECEVVGNKYENSNIISDLASVNAIPVEIYIQ